MPCCLLPAILLLAGKARLINSIPSRDRRRSSLGFAISFLALFLGILLLVNPSLSSVFIPLIWLLGILLVGILEVSLALQRRNSSHWYWLLLSGILTINLSILL